LRERKNATQFLDELKASLIRYFNQFDKGFVIIKQITMTNTFNIAGADGSVMVPELSETGSLMAYVLYPDTTGTLQELYSCMTIRRAFPDNMQAIPRHYNTHSSSTWGSTLYQGAPFVHKNAFGCTG